jgi:flagellar biosynthetic protein FliR
MTDWPAGIAADLPHWAFAFTLVLARISAATMLLPGLGETAPPAMLRAGLALGLTLILLPLIAPAVPPVPEAGLHAAAMVGAEAVTGLWFGWLARVLALALPIAAQFIAYCLGISSVLLPDVDLGPQSTALARLFELGAPLILLVSGLYAPPLAALEGLYHLVPPGQMLPAADSADVALRAVTESILLALRLASPFLLAAIVWNVATGLIARLVPRLQVYFAALPAQIFGGLLLLAVLSGALLAAWEDDMRRLLLALPGAG